MTSQLEPDHQRMIDEFAWPTALPSTVDEAEAFLKKYPPPSQRFEVRPPAAMDALEAFCGERALPEEYRSFLALHDGIEETWTKSGPYICGHEELEAMEARFSGCLDDLDEEHVEEAREEGEWIEPARLFPFGKNEAGDIHCFDLEIRTDGGHPVVIFDHAEGSMYYDTRCLPHFIAKVVCSARTHPQRSEPRLWTGIFERPKLTG